MNGVITKYLKTYAEDRALSYLEQFSGAQPFDDCVVVPAFNESKYIETLIESLERAAAFSKRRVITLLVLNHKISTPVQEKTLNRNLLEKLKSHLHENLYIKTLDFVSKGTEFGEKEGVGHARKIGSDLALQLHVLGLIKAPFFHNTDGDAIVPEDYFNVDWREGSAAVVNDYSHISSGDPLLDQAHELYEYSLRYYERGLSFAHSPYAFPTIGSLLTISFDHYAMVRGFPKRLAAEDFYILNKLAKVGKILKRSARVSLRARPSDRVPFGTGVGVADILEAGLENFKIYDPRTFVELKRTLAAMTDFPCHRDTDKTKATLAGGPLVEVLGKIGFWEMLEDAGKTRPRADDCLRHLNTAFDAFKTLKFVHEMRNSGFPMVPFSGETKSAEFIPGSSLP